MNTKEKMKSEIKIKTHVLDIIIMIIIMILIIIGVVFTSLNIYKCNLSPSQFSWPLL